MTQNIRREQTTKTCSFRYDLSSKVSASEIRGQKDGGGRQWSVTVTRIVFESSLLGISRSFIVCWSTKWKEKKKKMTMTTICRCWHRHWHASQVEDRPNDVFTNMPPNGSYYLFQIFPLPCKYLPSFTFLLAAAIVVDVGRRYYFLVCFYEVCVNITQDYLLCFIARSANIEKETQKKVLSSPFWYVYLLLSTDTLTLIELEWCHYILYRSCVFLEDVRRKGHWSLCVLLLHVNANK